MGSRDTWRQFYILDADHRVVAADLDTWAAMIEADGRLVDYTEINSALRVSTVFIGLDMAPWDDGPPKLFETMVFRNDSGDDCWRYSSWDDAVIGHKAAVRKLRGKQHVR